MISSSGFIMQQPKLLTIEICLRPVKSRRCMINPAVPQGWMETQLPCLDAPRAGWSMVPALHEHGLSGWAVAGMRWSHHAQAGSESRRSAHPPKGGSCESLGLGQGHYSGLLGWAILFCVLLFEKCSVWLCEEESRGNWWIWWKELHHTHLQLLEVIAVKNYCSVGQAFFLVMPWLWEES